MIADLMNKTELLTPREVCAILGIKVPTLRVKTQRQEIPSVKLGTAPNSPVRYRPEDVYRYIVEHTRSCASQLTASQSV